MKKAMYWTGWVLSGLVSALLFMSCSMKLMSPPEMVKSFTNDFGYPQSTLVPLGITEGLCTILYLIPQTSVLGAILLTGYLGGAVATHLRVEQASFIMPAIMGGIVWLGLFLRDGRIRALIPYRTREKP